MAEANNEQKNWEPMILRDLFDAARKDLKKYPTDSEFETETNKPSKVEVFPCD